MKRRHNVSIVTNRPCLNYDINPVAEFHLRLTYSRIRRKHLYQNKILKINVVIYQALF